MGVGGQGILTAGSVLANVAANNNLEVALTPVYSPAVRGGDSFVEIIISDAPIENPFMDHADLIFSLTSIDSASIIHYVDEKTELFYDETVDITCIPCNCGKYPVKIKNADVCRDPRKIGLVLVSFIIQYCFPQLMDAAKNGVILKKLCNETEWAAITGTIQQFVKRHLVAEKDA